MGGLEVLQKVDFVGYIMFESNKKDILDHFTVYHVEDFELFKEKLKSFLDRHYIQYTVESLGYYYVIKSTVNELEHSLYNIDEKVIMC